METSGEVRDIPLDPGSGKLRGMPDLIRDYIKRQQEKTTEKQQRIVNDSLEVAKAWLDGKLPLEEAIRLTGDGWLRMKVSHRLLGEDALIWGRFIEAIIDEQHSDCSLGVQTRSGFISASEIYSAGGRIERVYDQDLQQVVCIPRFPPVNLEHQEREERPSFFGATATQPASMVEWME